MRKQLLTTFAIQMHTGLDVAATNKEIALAVGVRTNNQASRQHVHCASTMPAGIVLDRGLGVSGRAGSVGGLLVPECFFGTLYWVPKGQTKQQAASAKMKNLGFILSRRGLHGR